MSALRVGLMGTAHVHAEQYAVLLARAHNVTWLGASEPDPACHLPGTRMFSSHEALLAEQPDAVVIASETASHLDLVRLAAQAGAHILCEKPIEVSLERAQALRTVCEASGVSFMTAFPMRFDPHLLDLRSRLQRGEVGEILALNGVNHSENPARHRAWFASLALAGGGATMDHSVHLTDLYRWLTGREITRISAEVTTAPGSEVDTVSLIGLDLGDGIFAAIDASWSRPAQYPRWGHLRLEVIGTHGTLDLDPMAQTVTVYSRHDRPTRWENWGPNSESHMLEAFLASVRAGTPPPVSWLDGYRALQVALAAVTSSATGQCVTFTSADLKKEG